MITKASYCIDSNLVIQGRKHLYPPRRFASLWHNVERLITEGRIRASAMVKAELSIADDEVCQWVRGQHGLFVPLDKRQTDEVTRIQEDFDDLVDHRKNKSGADPFVIALARVNGYTVVTLETMAAPNERTRIPNVCKKYGIPCIDLIGLMDAEGWTF
jgi:DNA-binding cell septation regulator SpoVG